MEKLFRVINLGREVRAEEVNAGETEPQNQPSGAEPTDTTIVNASTNTSASPTVNFESLISKARQEEKDKLYPEITRLKGELVAKTNRINELLLSLGEKDEIIKQKDVKIAELEKDSKKSQSEEVKSLNNKIEELTNTIALKDAEIASLKIEGYKTQKINEAQGKLIPELVVGNTPDEIDASIERAKQRYAEILAQVQSSAKPATQNSTQVPPVNPNVQNINNQTVNTMDLMGVSMFDKNARAQYAEMRAKLGLK